MMSGEHRGDVGLRGASRGITTVVLAAAGYTLTLWALAWLAALISRVA